MMAYHKIKLEQAPAPIRTHYATRYVSRVRIQDEPTDVVLVDTKFFEQSVTDRWERRNGAWVKV